MKLQYRTLKYYHETAPKITQYCTAIPQTLTPPSITEVLMILIDVLVYLLANNSAGSRPLDKGTAVCKNFLGPFGPHFGLKIRGGGGGGHPNRKGGRLCIRQPHSRAFYGVFGKLQTFSSFSTFCQTSHQNALYFCGSENKTKTKISSWISFSNSASSLALE